MLALDDLSFRDLEDHRTRLIIDMLSKRVYRPAEIADTLEVTGLSPGDYNLDSPAKIIWRAVVPDAAIRGKLTTLIARVVDDDPAFGLELDRQLQALLAPSGSGQWYHHNDPYTCGFVGPRTERAVIDRAGLRSGLYDLATDQYRILVISGSARSGKSHSWVLIDHLRNAGHLVGHRFVRVTTHFWSGEVTGEDLASSLADKLGLNLELRPSGEHPDARIRKLLDLMVGRYPQDDGVVRWILLDGLDRPGVQDSARDLVKRLITLVDENELPQTRLIVTGLDLLGLTVGYTVRVEEIPTIDAALVRSFLTDVAMHLGCTLTPAELDRYVIQVLGTGEPRDLRDIEKSVVQVVKSWVASERHVAT